MGVDVDHGDLENSDLSAASLDGGSEPRFVGIVGSACRCCEMFAAPSFGRSLWTMSAAKAPTADCKWVFKITRLISFKSEVSVIASRRSWGLEYSSMLLVVGSRLLLVVAMLN